MAPLFSWRPWTHSLAILLGVALLAIPLACDSPSSVAKDQADTPSDSKDDSQSETKTDTATDTKSDVSEASSESESTPEPTNKEDEAADSPETKPTESEPPQDPFKVPEKGAAELFDFIDRVQSAPLKPIRNENPLQAQARMAEHGKKIMEVVIQATQRIRGGEATDEEFAKALSYEHQALNYLTKLGDEAAGGQAKQLLEDAKEDKRPQVLQVVLTGMFELADQGDKEALKSISEVLSRLSKDDSPDILGVRMDSLFRLGSLGDQEATKNLRELLTQLEKDKRSEVAALVRRNSVRLGAQDWNELEAESKERLLKDFQEVLTEGEFDGEKLNFAMSVAEGIELAGDGAGAKKSYDALTQIMAGSGNRQLAMLAQQISMMTRSVEWLGKKFEIFGTLADGSTYDPKKYEGKIVLVDFWATWCGPCVQELPNVLAAYEQYHDKGFEVIGVSLDSEPEALNNFVEERKIPWANLFGKDASERGYEQPMALKYKIEAIPATFLLDGKGIVIAVNLRGPKLEKVLRQRLEAKKPSGEEKKAEEAPKAASPEAKPAEKKSDEAAKEKPAAEKPATEEPAKDAPEKKESAQDAANEADSKAESKKE